MLEIHEMLGKALSIHKWMLIFAKKRLETPPHQKKKNENSDWLLKEKSYIASGY